MKIDLEIKCEDCGVNLSPKVYELNGPQCSACWPVDNDAWINGDFDGGNDE